jgi:acyl transferase domain-containing protein
MTDQGVLSPTGSCKSFDVSADGYVRAEAINMVYLKRLDDALQDGNPIRAIIRATGTNFDGKTPGIAQPSPGSQEALIRATYKSADLTNFGHTTFVECHGTGTQTGDPLETSAIANVFGEQGVFIGSVKSNVGHSEGAAGLTALIKTVLSLENSTIPPNINFTHPNPKIPFEKGQLVVPTQPTPWPLGRYERASVNSFGIGGSNCHVVVDSAASFGIKPGMNTRLGSSSRLVVYSSNDASHTSVGTGRLQQHLALESTSLADFAYTLGTRRENHPYRSFAVVTENCESVFSNPAKASKTASDVAFVFNGKDTSVLRLIEQVY